MKKVKWYAGILACVSFLFAGCSEQDRMESISGLSQEITIKGSLEINKVSRSAVTDEGYFSWLEGDEIMIQASDNGFHPFTLSDGANSNNGNFTGSLEAGVTIEDGDWAVSPSGLNPSLEEDGSLSLVLPAEYEWEPQQTNAPMLALVEDGKLAFKNLGGLVKFFVKNITDECEIQVTSSTHHLSGEIKVIKSGDNYILQALPVNGDSSLPVVITSTASEMDQAFYLPLPVAEGMKLEVQVYEGESLRLERKTTLSVKRNQLILMPTLTLPKTDNALVGNATSTTNLGDVFETAVSDGNQEVIVTVNSNASKGDESASATIEVREDIEIPTALTTNQGASVNITFDEVPVAAGSNDHIVLTDKNDTPTSGESVSTVTVAIPEVTDNVDAPSFEIKLESSTVTLAATNETATFGTVWAATADQTLIVDEGVVVENLVANKGSIEISGTVNGLERDENHQYGNEKTEVRVKAGATLNNVVDEDGFVIIREDAVTITNQPFSYILSQRYPDAVQLVDGNAVFTKEWAESLTELNMGTGWYRDVVVKNLEGIENFPNIEYFCCAYQGVEECDFSANKKLEQIYVYGNNLRSINVSENAALKTLGVNYNSTLTTLDISGCLALEILDIEDTSLTNIDFSKNASLQSVRANNVILESVDFSHNPELQGINFSGSSKLASLDLTGCSKLSRVDVANTALTSLELEAPEKVTLLSISGVSGLANMSLSSFTGLTQLSCGNLGWTSIGLTATQKSRITSLTCRDNLIETLDLSEYPELAALNCEGNKMTELDASVLSNLQTLVCGPQQSGTLVLILNDSQKELWTSKWELRNSGVKLAGEVEENVFYVQNYEELKQALEHEDAMIAVVKSFDIIGLLRVTGAAEIHLENNTLTVNASMGKEGLITNDGTLKIVGGEILNSVEGYLFTNNPDAVLTLSGVTINSANEKPFIFNEGTFIIENDVNEAIINGGINNCSGTVLIKSGHIVGFFMNQMHGKIQIDSGTVKGDLMNNDTANENAVITIASGVDIEGSGWESFR